MLSVALLSFLTLLAHSKELLISQNRHPENICLSDNYYGTYSDGWSVFISPDNCFGESQVSGALVPLSSSKDGKWIMLWIQEAGVAEELLEDHTTLLDVLSIDHLTPREGQVMMSTSEPSIRVHFATPSEALVEIPSSSLVFIDTLLPARYVPVIVPSSPIPFELSSRSRPRITQLRDSLSYDKSIASIVDSMPISQFLDDILYLTGEESTITSRHSFTEGALEAAEWISKTISGTGAKCEKDHFTEGFAPNVICRYPATTNTTETVILGAHYDSRGSFGNIRAPGANDDGSGTTSLLSIARTIATKKVKFHANVELIAFAGEEQGLVGSSFYARRCREEDKNLTMMIQSDMLAYHADGEPPQLGIPDIGDPDLVAYLKNVSSLYSPELYVGPTRACCSDHQSFVRYNFSAAMAFERAGPIVDPMYHNSLDLSNRTGYDIEQVRSITKVTFASLLHAAGFDAGSS